MILKPMASEGETKEHFGRQYTFINPNASIGPGTWRLSTIDEIASQGGGGAGVLDVSGTVPITSTAIAAGEVDISIDISNLPEKS